MTIQVKEKFFYASGAVANGVKTDAFTFFLLFFYSNIIGLSPGLASLAIFIALMIDALQTRSWVLFLIGPGIDLAEGTHTFY